MKKGDPKRAAALIERLGRLLGTEAHTDGLLPVQWEVLRYLARANRFSRTAAALVAYLGLTKGTVSQTLKALESKKLVRKRTDSKDRRRVQLSLTAKGKRYLCEDPLRLMETAIANLGTSTQAGLNRGLESLLSSRLESEGRLPFGLCRNCVHFSRDHVDANPAYCRLLNEILSDDDSSAICYEQQPASGVN